MKRMRLSWRLPTAFSRWTRLTRGPGVTQSRGLTRALPGGLTGSLAVLPRPPLPWTSAVMALLIVLPSLALWRWPRPRAEGLEQLMASASLLQSFPATPGRRLPNLWRQRLGEGLGAALWQRQTRPWWQIWGPEGHGLPFLVLQASGWPLELSKPLPPQALRINDLMVVAPDPLSRQSLADSLRPQQRRSRGLHSRCLERLSVDQAVFWNPTALGAMVGPLAPLMQRFQEGCLSLSLEAKGLSWEGEATSVDGVLAQLDTAAIPVADPVATLPLPADELLEVQGGSLQDLLEGLLSRQLIREPLALRYGLDSERLRGLRFAPFRLRLRPQPQGPFQASLELQVRLRQSPQMWLPVLERLAQSLRDQGFKEIPFALAATLPSTPTAPATEPKPETSSKAATPPPGSTAPQAVMAPKASGVTTAESANKADSPNTADTTNKSVNPGKNAAEAPPTTTSGIGSGNPSARQTKPLHPRPSVNPLAMAWRRSDGAVVGGWRWIAAPSGQDAEVLFFLGPAPAQVRLMPSRAFPRERSLQLRVRPRALDQLGLLPADVPQVVRGSEQLWTLSEPLTAPTVFVPVSRLRGGLSLAPCADGVHCAAVRQPPSPP